PVLVEAIDAGQHLAGGAAEVDVLGVLRGVQRDAPLARLPAALRVTDPRAGDGDEVSARGESGLDPLLIEADQFPGALQRLEVGLVGGGLRFGRRREGERQGGNGGKDEAAHRRLLGPGGSRSYRARAVRGKAEAIDTRLSIDAGDQPGCAGAISGV